MGFVGSLNNEAKSKNFVACSKMGKNPWTTTGSEYIKYNTCFHQADSTWTDLTSSNMFKWVCLRTAEKKKLSKLQANARYK